MYRGEEVMFPDRPALVIERQGHHSCSCHLLERCLERQKADDRLRLRVRKTSRMRMSRLVPVHNDIVERRGCHCA